MRNSGDLINEWELPTVAIRTGHQRTGFAEHSEPIVATSSFVFEDAAHAAACFAGDEEAFVYSRFSNPTVTAFEARLAAMEGGEACMGTASGMAAIMTLVLTVTSAGDHIVASKSMFGSTVSLFDKILPRFGIQVTWVELTEIQAWEQAITDKTRLFFLETPTNPLTQLVDLKALSAICQASNVLLAVDNCFCTPALQRPLDLGADIVIHSATKFIDGQGRCVGGAIVGPQDLLQGEMLSFMRSAGPSMSPFNAWVFLKGLETLSLRMERHCSNAMAVAEWLQQQEKIDVVNYPGLVNHPQHVLASSQQTGYGAVVSFELKGGQSAAWRLIDELRLVSITANLGDAKSTITHPATTTHSRVSEADRLSTGIKPGLVRIALGLEHSNDLLQDLDRGLRAV